MTEPLKNRVFANLQDAYDNGNFMKNCEDDNIAFDLILHAEDLGDEILDDVSEYVIEWRVRMGSREW